ncbi:Serine protease [Phytophthora megakarya]|uniref:subtilisin n=1 Tax=Phytophthora megakarya TaxID=4795 RepID=A0A225W8M3_9STRA|nr:Serine protease [Phytophthora megakarya]
MKALIGLVVAGFGRCAALQDAQGLAFVDAAAFCAFHCSSASLSWSSQCSTTLCGRERALQAADEQIDVLACNSVAQNASTLAFSLTLSSANSAQVFQGFHDAFFQAYDAMLSGDSITADACQLEFLQDKLLPTVQDEDTDQEEQAERKPKLVKLRTGEEDQDRECIKKMPTDDMPLLTRRGDRLGDNTVLLVHATTAVADQLRALECYWTCRLTRRGDRLGENTVLLVHATTAVADQLRALECVDKVLDLPPILKLMPFARSAAHLSDRMTKDNSSMAPAMEIRLVQEADRESVKTALEQRARELFGLLNVFETNEIQPRSIFTKPLQDLRTWTNILALAVVESSVEWMDERQEITQNLLRGEEQERWTQLQSHRRLDTFVPSLVGVDSAREAGIRGNEVVVGITDTGLYLLHDQFDQDDRDVYSGMVLSARKVVMYNDWANKADEAETITCGHGTHVAGLLAGSSFSGKNDDLGIADKARIAFMDIGTQSKSCAGKLNCAVSLATPADAKDLLESQIDAGAKIFSFSWGTPGSDYSSQARDLDAFIYENPDVLVVVAAGNSGETSTTGQRTISSPSGAKNVISVGASLNAAASFTEYACTDIFNEHTVASFSSAGPTTDGRLKPDVVAPGMSLISSQSEAPGSTKTSSATCSLQGTSQATPVVTGVAVLLYEWLRDGWWKDGTKNSAYAMKTVPASLLKALIIHSGDSLQKRMAALPASGVVSCSSLTKDATDVAYPDVYQGYGKPNLTNIVDFTGASGTNGGNSSSEGLPSLYFLPNSSENSEPAVAHGGEMVISFTVARDVDLRATLVWTDPPGSTQATSQLQHDLDLVVRVRNGTQTFGPLTADSGSGKDAKNNVEMVQVSYADLFAAATGSNSSSSGNETNSPALGADGEIVVEAVIYGRSVLLADQQKFAFVASSSAIGSMSGSTAATSDSESFWSAWAVAIIVGSTIVLLIVIALATRWIHGRSKRGMTRRVQYPGQAGIAGAAYHPTYQAATTTTHADRCPYCPFATPDPVLMVDHVETIHNNGMQPAAPEGGLDRSIAVLGGSRIFGLEPTVPVVTVSPNVPQGQVQGPPEDEKHQCPHCRFVTQDAVILLNHVHHMHGQ